MKVLVTGASGFVGRALAAALAGRHEMRAVPRGEVDRALVTGADAVVHLANLAHTSASERELHSVNVHGTRRVGEAAAANGVRRLVYLSSVKASCEETGRDAIDGTERPAPSTPYGVSKLLAEAALNEISGRTGLEVICLRPPLVYGPGVKANFLALIKSIDAGCPLPLRSISCQRSLIYVENLAEAIVAALEAPPSAVGRAYVLSDGPPLSIPELCTELGAALQRSVRLFRFPPALLEHLPGFGSLTRSLVIDPAPFMDSVGWAPAISAREGLRRTARWYRSR